MKQHSNPMEYLIEFAEKHGIDNFILNNAKDELSRLRKQSSPYELVGWARINERGDLYDPRFCYNPYVHESIVMPLYANKKEFYERYGKSSK